MRTYASTLAGLAITVLTLAGPLSTAGAQQVSGGATLPVMGLFVRGVDTASDPAGNYLVVGGQGTLYAGAGIRRGQPSMACCPSMQPADTRHFLVLCTARSSTAAVS